MQTTSSVGVDSRRNSTWRIALLAVLLGVSLLGWSVAGCADDLPDLGKTGDDQREFYRFIDGYELAFGALKHELHPLMWKQKLLIVWLFDESESMQDDRKAICHKLPEFYEDLVLAAQKEHKQQPADDALMTSIMSFGDTVTEHTQGPTTKIDDILNAMDGIEIEDSGRENTCKAISTALAKYGPLAQKQQRRLVVVLATDESGDDGTAIEDVIERAKKLQSQVFVLGRESQFGYPYARIAWTDPKYMLRWWLTINRGPETAFPELLQTDGLHERWDNGPSGFGSYELMRLARETGGVYFILADADDDVEDAQSTEERRAELEAMKKYVPDMTSRIDYARERDASKFRHVQWQVVNVLNPHKDAELKIQELHYSADPEAFAKQGAVSFQRAIRALQLFNEALKLLDSVKPLRAEEKSLRWRANYDLMHAQCQAYRVRLFQLLLALDQHKKNEPAPQVGKGFTNNVWNAVRQKEMLPPDPEQVKLAKTDLEELNAQMESATKEFQAVIDEHPQTPWARRAKDELTHGFGIKFVDGYHDFKRYAQGAKDIKLPSP